MGRFLFSDPWNKKSEEMEAKRFDFFFSKLLVYCVCFAFQLRMRRPNTVDVEISVSSHWLDDDDKGTHFRANPKWLRRSFVLFFRWAGGGLSAFVWFYWVLLGFAAFLPSFT